MEKADIVIRGGTLVDGSGTAPRRADVAIANGLILAVGDLSGVDGANAEQIDATGCHVTPGFVDIHTHYDGQAIWAERLQPSSVHGVTTVVVGNCGVGFAPCRSEDQDRLIAVMEGVEDIPGAVMADGLDWNWESFGEYLDAVDGRDHDIDVAAYLPHSPLRVFVMGERGVRREPATAEDLAQMRVLVVQAMQAGALGCATSRLSYHRTSEGELIPSYGAEREELCVLADAMAQAGGGLLQVVPDFGAGDVESELSLLADVARRTGVPVTFTGTTGASSSILRDPLDRYASEGLNLSGQIFPRPIGMVMGLDLSWNPFSFCPSYGEVADLPLADRVARMRDPDLRARLLAEQPDHSRFPLARQTRNFERTFPIAQTPDYEPSADQSIAAQAARAGISPEALVYDALLELDGQAMLLVAMGNYQDGSLDTLAELIGHPRTVLGLGDGGAHYGLICDASYPSTILSHWVRDRAHGRLPIEQAVRELARKPAEVVGLLDRGLLAPGYKADVNIIDLSAVRLFAPEVVRDLPAGGRRLLQRAQGYRATLVAGQVTYRDGNATDRLPGRLVRGRQQAPRQAA
ncbi:amidohydrolase family protein [Sphingobium sp. AS12]|uniref:amidohydrolase family protein n=1 Tax=Sphingobium sp. AS12 TaxID=2849495 RepID=UPI0034A30117